MIILWVTVFIGLLNIWYDLYKQNGEYIMHMVEGMGRNVDYCSVVIDRKEWMGRNV